MHVLPAAQHGVSTTNGQTKTTAAKGQIEFSMASSFVTEETGL